MFAIFYHFPQTIARIFSGKNLWWHTLAILLTFILVTTGFDWWWLTHLHASVLSAALFSAVRVGHNLPILLPLILLFWGFVRKRSRIINTGWALGQAALLGWLISSFYKAFTGRPGPPFHHHYAHAPVTDISHVFRFGFWRGGIFWGWPSSHTAVAFAMAFTLFYLYRENKWIRSLAPLYAIYIGLGVSMSIHWFSDFVAGAIFGFVIGSVVGSTFMQRAKLNPF